MSETTCHETFLRVSRSALHKFAEWVVAIVLVSALHVVSKLFLLEARLECFQSDPHPEVGNSSAGFRMKYAA